MEDNKLIIYKNSAGNIVVDAIYKDETYLLLQQLITIRSQKTLILSLK